MLNFVVNFKCRVLEDVVNSSNIHSCLIAHRIFKTAGELNIREFMQQEFLKQKKY